MPYGYPAAYGYPAPYPANCAPYGLTAGLWIAVIILFILLLIFGAWWWYTCFC